VCLFKPSSLQRDLHTVTSMYLSARVSVPRGAGVVCLPKVLRLYCKDFVGWKSKRVAGLGTAISADNEQNLSGHSVATLSTLAVNPAAMRENTVYGGGSVYAGSVYGDAVADSRSQFGDAAPDAAAGSASASASVSSPQRKPHQAMAGSYSSTMALSPEPAAGRAANRGGGGGGAGAGASASTSAREREDASNTDWDQAGFDRKFAFVSSSRKPTLCSLEELLHCLNSRCHLCCSREKKSISKSLCCWASVKGSLESSC
jgi:hypothetical protein